jgi:DNA-binding transcriptional MerR regulator
LESLKVKEVAALLNETPAIIRNWVRDYKGLIPIEKAETGYNLFPAEAVEVLRTIQRMARQQGYSTRQIEAFLRTGVIASAGAATEEVAASGVAVDPAAASVEIAELRGMVQQLLDSQQRQEEFNRQLVERLDRRDRQLTEYISERRLEIKQQEIEQQRRPWWKFGRRG